MIVSLVYESDLKKQIYLTYLKNNNMYHQAKLHTYIWFILLSNKFEFFYEVLDEFIVFP